MYKKPTCPLTGEICPVCVVEQSHICKENEVIVRRDLATMTGNPTLEEARKWPHWEAWLEETLHGENW